MIISAHTCDTINRRSNTARRAHFDTLHTFHWKSSIVDVGHTFISFSFFFVNFFPFYVGAWKALRCFRLETVEVFVLLGHSIRLLGMCDALGYVSLLLCCFCYNLFARSMYPRKLGIQKATHQTNWLLGKLIDSKNNRKSQAHK